MEQLLDIFRVEGWKDALLLLLDAAIVYFVIYRILLLIKGTRAVQMLFGLVVIIMFFVISQEQYLNLATTHWFIERFIANFIIIVVIIFQHDIRRALAQFGRTSLLAGTRAFEETQVLEEIIKASVMLSSRKIGALVAIEREADLSHYTEEGIKIDSVVSKDLLFSVFVPEHQNPLHDGAVVVQKGRVTAAGCFLPLTNNPRVEKTLGTRHRAGIGLTEDTDAAVVIVSEETGIISIAYGGELYRDLDANEMRDLLQRIFSASQVNQRGSGLIDSFREQRDTDEPVGAKEARD
ncbi:TIGR00159 family protein [Persicimonas caeni]|uniref:Diadenylate cyclase n=1 Tax=Persicimonas caeni TaxID=2292766 RepID=A0A4Y6PNQ9_PERCE|nr:diadenylate cyclase CdaA [Persicimonas caeni]QDG49829.1 TIGR00159 family protein [Persicimonas caeni]QED31050.1 TIGR00159 family protein [Persicimonas caeni]